MTELAVHEKTQRAPRAFLLELARSRTRLRRRAPCPDAARRLRRAHRAALSRSSRPIQAHVRIANTRTDGNKSSASSFLIKALMRHSPRPLRSIALARCRVVVISMNRSSSVSVTGSDRLDTTRAARARAVRRGRAASIRARRAALSSRRIPLKFARARRRRPRRARNASARGASVSRRASTIQFFRRAGSRRGRRCARRRPGCATRTARCARRGRAGSIIASRNSRRITGSRPIAGSSRITPWDRRPSPSRARAAPAVRATRSKCAARAVWALERALRVARAEVRPRTGLELERASHAHPAIHRCPSVTRPISRRRAPPNDALGSPRMNSCRSSAAETHQDRQRRRLARAVAAEQRVDLARAHGERESRQHAPAAEAALDVFDRIGSLISSAPGSRGS